MFLIKKRNTSVPYAVLPCIWYIGGINPEVLCVLNASLDLIIKITKIRMISQNN